MNFLQLIEAKREGQALAAGQIAEAIAAYSADRIPDYQMAAFLMAVFFRGLDRAETKALTLAMYNSGDVLSFPRDSRPLVDKHSTGGVGDKVSLPLAPLLACLGFRVPMISGRGLGITGGTLDKLDSIPGFQTTLSRERIVETVQKIGCVICGQTERMVPADKRLYALRDVTGTVPSIPLIVASILSKKMAEGLTALVLDVKFGAAAFMPALDKARELALAMVSLGTECGINTRALLTRMEAPLGRSAGNWLEVKEAVALLEGRTGASLADLEELVTTSAAQLLVQTGHAKGLSLAREQAAQCLRSGQPRKKWDDMLHAQGADLDAFRHKLEQDRCATETPALRAWRGGFVSRCDARVIGEAVRDLGGGRLTKDSALDYEAGMDRIAKPGDPVSAGSILARIHAGDAARASTALVKLKSAFEISAAPPDKVPLIAKLVG